MIFHTAMGLDTGPDYDSPVDFSEHKLISILPKRLKQLHVLEKLKLDFNVNYIDLNYNFFDCLIS